LGIAPDFQLLFTLPEDKFYECRDRFKDANVSPPHIIGFVNNDGKNRFYKHKDADPLPVFPGENWNHQGIEEYLDHFKFS